ncbi:helix-hairpin-helix domain-containing protein [Latilactobacillus sakei]|uniref:ComEA family DNA-binding protein n=1 Tax=Latilactobacillus sakei TaxID=1599 RepID=UPI000AA74CA3
MNQADSTQLQTLNGIGPKKAEQIIAYRDEQGKFKQIEDLQKVGGIGPKTFEQLQSQICVN